MRVSDSVKRSELLVGIEGLTSIAALFALSGWRLTGTRLAVAGVIMTLTVGTLFLIRMIRNLGAAWQLRLIFFAGVSLAAAIFPFFYYDNPEIDRVAPYFRQAVPLTFLLALFGFQIAYLSGRSERAGNPIPFWVRARFVCARALIVLSVLIVMCAYLPIRRNYYPSNDFSIFSYIGSVIRSGGLPYVDAWDHKPPLIFYLNAIGLSIADGHLIGIWLLEVVFLTASLFLLFRLLNTVVSVRIALPVVFFGMIHLARLLDFGNYTEEFALLFQIGAVALLIFSVRRDRFCEWFLSGLLMGLAFSLKQPLIGAWFGIGVCVVMEALADSVETVVNRFMRVLKIGLSLSAGFAAVNLAWAAYFARRGAFGEYVFGAFTYNFFYTAYNGTSRWATYWTTVNFLPTLSPFLALGLIGWVVAVIRLVRAFHAGCGAAFVREKKLIVWAAAALPFEIFLAGLSGMNYQHYFMPMVPAYLVLIGALTEWTAKRFYTRENVSPRKVLIGTLALFALGSTPMIPVLKANYAPRNPSALTKTADFLRENSAPNEKAYLWAANNAPLVLSRRFSPTEFFFTKWLYPMRSGAIQDAIWAEMLRDFENDPPKFVIMVPEIRAAPRVPYNEDGFCAPNLTTVPGERRIFAYFCENYRYRETINPGMNDAYGVFEYFENSSKEELNND